MTKSSVPTPPATKTNLPATEKDVSNTEILNVLMDLMSNIQEVVRETLDQKLPAQQTAPVLARPLPFPDSIGKELAALRLDVNAAREALTASTDGDVREAVERAAERLGRLLGDKPKKSGEST